MSNFLEKLSKLDPALADEYKNSTKRFLEDHEVLTEDVYVRQLKSISGSPVISEWRPFNEVLGNSWLGYSVKDFNDKYNRSFVGEPRLYYEFIVNP